MRYWCYIHRHAAQEPMNRSNGDRNEFNSTQTWTLPEKPKRILVIRFHAIGDVAITLSSCVALQQAFPTAQIDFLTTQPSAELPQSLTIFNNILIYPSGGTRLKRIAKTIEWMFRLMPTNYDIVIDLQRNWVSRSLRLAVHPKAWSEFDRFSPFPAGERVIRTFHQIGFEHLRPVYHLPFRQELLSRAQKNLFSNGRNETTPLVVLNPAGLWPTRNWPTENYVELGKKIIDKYHAQLLLIGTERIEAKARFLTDRLGDAVLNLVGKTTLAEAYAFLQFTSAVVSEDSGLMHMAWTSGVPTVALFGSSRHDWSAPLGSHVKCLHSGDLECGACMEPTCKYGDIHCLTRYSPQRVFDELQEFLAIRAEPVTVI